MPVSDCPFCALPSERAWLAREHALALRDGYPISQGHTLIVSRRHVGSIFELTRHECDDVLALLVEARERLQAELSPAAFNVGVNDGSAAGQTVPHAHVHLIPRYCGDVADPRGGVRWLIPDKADYWSAR